MEVEGEEEEERDCDKIVFFFLNIKSLGTNYILTSGERV